MDPLNILSMQTMTSPQFDPSLVDYENAWVKNPMADTAAPVPIAPRVQMPQQQQQQRQEQPIQNLAAATRVSIKSNRTALASIATQGVEAAPPYSITSDKLYLAAACGNCARAYGNPLVCALLKIQISQLTACDNFASPFEIENDSEN